MGKAINWFLLAVFIVGSAFAVIFDPFENDIISIFICLIFTASVTLLPNIKELERTKKTKIENINSKKWTIVSLAAFLSLLAFGTIYNVIIFIIGIINRVNEGIVFFSRITFWFGLLWIIFMSGIVIEGIIKRRRLFASENIRRYVFIYLNFFMGLMLILK